VLSFWERRCGGTADRATSGHLELSDDFGGCGVMTMAQAWEAPRRATLVAFRGAFGFVWLVFL
jgi:hypothetical protein